MNVMHDPAFRIYALCAVVLVMKMLLVGLWTAVVRGRLGAALNPEDAGAAGPREAEHPEVARVLRVHRNDVENIPLFLAIGLIYVLAGAGRLGAAVYCVTFTAARIAHSMVYLAGKQPWRTILYSVGVACLLGMMVRIVMRALAA